MSSRLGIEIGSRHIRAVRYDGWLRRSVRAAEFDWEGEGLDDAIGRVERELGGANHVSLALDMPLVFAKEIPLPTLQAAEKTAILALEPERYFPVRGEEMLLAARNRDHLVFAARESVVAEAVAAAGRLGPIDRVEPAPHALARALDGAGVRSGSVVVPWTPRGALIVRLEHGEVVGIRWLHGGMDAAAQVVRGGEVAAPLFVAVGGGSDRNAEGASGPTTEMGPGLFDNARPLPLPSGIARQFLVAYGAALGADAPFGESLAPPDLERRITGRRRRRAATAIAMVIGAAIFALLSIERAAADAATALTQRADSLSVSAERALALRAESDALDRRRASVATLAAARTDPLAVLAALGQRMPPDAWLRSIRAAGPEWQVDGYARDAAILVPTLEAASEFENVRFLTATTTERVGTRSHERFSIAFRLAGKP